MSNNCSQCGISIPDDQRVCSMCYGDPAYGHDGYYAEYLEEQVSFKNIAQSMGDTHLTITSLQQLISSMDEVFMKNCQL